MQSARSIDAPLLAGVELGGTKCVVTLASGPNRIVVQQHVATTSPGETLAAIAAILESWTAREGFAALGIASFGPIDLNPASHSFGHVLTTNKPGWAGADIVGQLGSKLAVPVALDTDVNGAALAEMRWGCATGLRDFAYVTVGTGVGVGLIVNGAPTRGIGHSELGHLRVPRLAGDDRGSGCRFHGDCVEGLASGPGIRAMLGEQPIDEAGADHPVWDRVVNAVAVLCHALVCAAGPRRIAIGGGVFERQPHLLARIEPALVDSLAGYIILPRGGPYVVAPQLGPQAGPMGPIALASAALERHRVTLDARKTADAI